MGIRWVIIALLVLSCAWSARIEGAIYDENLEPIPRSIISINTTPEQSRVSQYGGFFFIVPPGSYELTVHRTIGSQEHLIAREIVTISDDGVFAYDIIASQSQEKFFFPWIITGSILAIFVIIGILIHFGRKRLLFLAKKELAQESQETHDQRLEKKVLEVLEKNDGSIEQKILRRSFKVSEAKISLLLAQLERDGKIQKVKQGRTNLVQIAK